jgi:hypothetical protein
VGAETEIRVSFFRLMEHFSGLIPKWLLALASPSCKSVLLYGCGGGFDFSHALLLIPSLIRSGKKVVIASNSFTTTPLAFPDSATYYTEPTNPRNIAKLVRPQDPDSPETYCPEEPFVRLLAEAFPDVDIPVYASSCHTTSVPANEAFLGQLIREHTVDTVITIDGGTDSLMRGNEYRVATVIEDFMSLAALDDLRVTFQLQNAFLLVFSFGADRFHGASDASSLRAIAELTRMGGYLGSSSIDQASEGFALYANYLRLCKTKYTNMTPSIVGAFVAAAVVGQYGPYQTAVKPDPVPRDFARSGVPQSAIELFNLTEDGSEYDSVANRRVRPKDGYIWPLMGEIFGFAVDVVMKRNLIAERFKPVRTFEGVGDIYLAEKRKLDPQRLPVEDIPLTAQMTH